MVTDTAKPPAPYNHLHHTTTCHAVQSVRLYTDMVCSYDVLVRHVDQIEQDITEPFPEVELRTESVAPQMDPIVEEAEDDGHADEEVWHI